MSRQFGMFWGTKKRRRLSRYERELKSLLKKRDTTIAALEQEISDLQEVLKRQQSTNRIQQVEIDELTAVVARNLERVKAETQELAMAATSRAAVLRAALEEGSAA